MCRKCPNDTYGAKVTEPDKPADSRQGSELAFRRQQQGDAGEGRQSAMQAISARLPAGLVEELAGEAARRGIRPSELVREAVEALLRKESGANADLNASVSYQVTIMTPLSQYQNENSNLVVEVPTEPNQVVALGYSL
jgi:hypothetical protein